MEEKFKASDAVIPMSRNKLSNWLEDFSEKQLLESGTNHLLVSKSERSFFRKKIKKNLSRLIFDIGISPRGACERGPRRNFLQQTIKS